MSADRPFGLSRREHIMDELRRTGSVRVRGLARELDVAELTIRRDIGRLADEGLVTRVHGGATLRSELDTTVPVRSAPSAPRFRVGMVVPSLTYYWPQVIVGARAAATDQRVQLAMRGASYLVDDQRRQIASLVDGGGVHGLIVAPENSGPDGHAILEWLDTLRIPVVLIERRSPAALGLTRLEWVTTDHDFGGELALRHLAARGHRRVGIVTSAQSPTSAQLRRGWFRAVDELAVASLVDMSASLDNLASTARVDVLNALFDDVRRTGCTALMVHSDPQAVLVQQFAAERGWSVPDDLAILAYDDEIAADADPPLTALRPAKEHVGRRAVETMAARLAEGARRPIERLQIVPELRERGSTRVRSD